MTDIVSAMRTINKVGKYVLTAFLVLNIIGIAFAADNSALSSGLKEACTTARAVLAIAAIVMVILAAIVYALGQVMGAETRARATVWATAMLTGGIIGVIIYALVPTIISTIMGGTAGGVTFDPAKPCDITVS